jgi:integrase
LENIPASLAAKRYLALLRLQYITGCRSGEVAAITFDDLELTEGPPAARIRARNSKTNESRTVYINNQAKNDLVIWFEALQEAGYSGQAIFPTLYNGIPGENAVQAVGIYQMLQRRLKEAKLPPRRAHSLRHASARHALAKGIDLRKIRDQLGHSSISVTAKYLGGHDPDRAEAYNNWE